ncbi:MAG TPA: HEAT repeat domain-containing protein [Pirellulales bacterium]|nr:HEAT repeat domain-containing protein [Pirellulales bacterium]
MSDSLPDLLLPDVFAAASQSDARWSAYCDSLAAARVSAADLPATLGLLADLTRRDDLATTLSEPLAADRFWSPVLEKLWCGLPAKALSESLDAVAVKCAAEIYRYLGADSRARPQLLRLLAGSGQRPALATFAGLVVSDPPSETNDVLLAFVPLFQHKTYPADALFPRLLDAMHGPMLATVVLDLANYLTRCGRVSRHPAAGRVERLSGLLGGMVNRLARLEERPDEFARSPAELNQIVSDSTGLVVALMNALAMIGDPRVAGKLHQTLELSHRRVRTEAASALARLGDERGTEVLVDMAAEPVVRLRALATLEEIEQLEQVPQQYRSPEARAEAELAVRLALPTYFGAPPQRMELVDACRQHWPGYEHEVDCYLFRYEYRLAERTLQGIGIAGPVVHAFRADLGDLPPQDIYAAYAGWITEHDEIREQAADALTAADLAAWQRRRGELVGMDYDDPRLVKAGAFFGQIHYVATARRQGQPGILVDDGLKVEWFSSTGAARALGPEEAYLIVKGRKLLRGCL